MIGLSRYLISIMYKSKRNGLYQAKEKEDKQRYSELDKRILDAYRRVNEQHEKTQEKKDEKNDT